MLRLLSMLLSVSMALAGCAVAAIGHVPVASGDGVAFERKTGVATVETPESSYFIHIGQYGTALLMVGPIIPMIPWIARSDNSFRLYVHVRPKAYMKFPSRSLRVVVAGTEHRASYRMKANNCSMNGREGIPPEDDLMVIYGEACFEYVFENFDPTWEFKVIAAGLPDLNYKYVRAASAGYGSMGP